MRSIGGKAPRYPYLSDGVYHTDDWSELGGKGVAQDVVVAVTMTQTGAVTTATGSFPIKRLTFKIGEGEWADTGIVADPVLVKFKLALTGVGKL